MKKKAIANLELAQELINHQKDSLCTISVHCSYYAVFQYMMYVLANTGNNPISYEIQKNKTKCQSSHDYIINEVGHRITNRYKASNFTRQVRVLKNKRALADYGKDIFSVEESLMCKNLADSLIAKLKCYFGNI